MSTLCGFYVFVIEVRVVTYFLSRVRVDICIELQTFFVIDFVGGFKLDVCGVRRVYNQGKIVKIVSVIILELESGRHMK